jgi:hypothetical protein
MATLIRTSKSGSDWTPNDLLAYNIRVEYQDSETFFGIANLPQPHVHKEVLIAPDAAATQNDDPYTLLRTMDLAMAFLFLYNNKEKLLRYKTEITWLTFNTFPNAPGSAQGLGPQNLKPRPWALLCPT